MENNTIEQKLTRKIFINYFVDNYGKFHTKYFFHSFMVEVILFITVSIFLISLLIEGNNYIIAAQDVQFTFHHFIEWVFFNNIQYVEELDLIIYNLFGVNFDIM